MGKSFHVEIQSTLHVAACCPWPSQMLNIIISIIIIIIIRPDIGLTSRNRQRGGVQILDLWGSYAR